MSEQLNVRENQVEVRLFAYLREGRGKQLFMDAGQNVQQVITALNIADEDAYIVLINGRDAGKSTLLKAGDVLSIFPQVGGG